MRQITFLRLFAPAMLLLVVAASSCGGCYYARVGYGQARVLLGRESIDDALASDRLTSEEKQKLALVPTVRAFAQDKVGLVKNGSYTKFYDTGDKPVSWNVTACEATSFKPVEWTFPFVGKAAYKGFFDVEHARAEAAGLEAEGYDVVVREVGAYSTLGWFDDPVFRRMLAGDVHDLANTIIHELTHATVFKSGDIAFNESVATFVGNEGALAFLRAQYGGASKELKIARDRAADEKVFSDYVDGLYAKLDALYRSQASPAEKRARREQIFAASKDDFETVRKTKMRRPQDYAGFIKKKLNNAVLLGYRHYHTDLDTFRDVFRLCGGDFKRALEVFREAATVDRPQEYLAGWSHLARAKRLDEAATKAAHDPSAGEKGEKSHGEQGDEEAGTQG